MPAPVVQGLDQILASLAPAYSGQSDVINQQKAALPGKFQAQTEALGAEKTNTFRDINTGANAKGLAFSGIPIEEQARYLGTKYLPGLTNLKTQQNTEDLTLSGQLASLEGEKRLRALDTQNQQTKALSDWQNAEELRSEQQAFDKWKMANDQAFQLKLEGLKATNAQALARTNNAAQPDPLGEFSGYIASQFQKSGGQGNQKTSRQTQDAWANAWLDSHGVTGQARNAYWNYFNTTYNRSSDPTKDPRYR